MTQYLVTGHDVASGTPVHSIVTDTNPDGPGVSFAAALAARPRPLFLTIGSGNTPYGQMIRDQEPRHQAYCEKWGYEYRAVFECKSAWDKLELTLKAMECKSLVQRPYEGVMMDDGWYPTYSHIFIIDADAVVIDFEEDMRNALPSWAFLGLTTHPYPMLDVWHWNVGCSYWQNTPQGREFLTEVLKAKDRPQWHEQAEVNRMLMDEPERWQSGFVQLSRHWNNNWHDQPHKDAIVMAWHGYLEPAARRMVMQGITQDYPYASN